MCCQYDCLAESTLGEALLCVAAQNAITTVSPATCSSSADRGPSIAQLWGSPAAMRLLRKVVYDCFPGTADADAKLGSSKQLLPESTAALHSVSSSSHVQQSVATQQQTAAWDALPAPALILVAAQLPRSSLPIIRMVCKAWAGHVTEVLTETMPSAYPSLAHEATRKDGMLMFMLFGQCHCLLHVAC